MQMSEGSLIVLGVDGGATKTACAAVLLSSQQHLNQASAGPSNWYALISQSAELPCRKFASHSDLTVCWRCDDVASISVCKQSSQCKPGEVSAKLCTCNVDKSSGEPADLCACRSSVGKEEALQTLEQAVSGMRPC